MVHHDNPQSLSWGLYLLDHTNAIVTALTAVFMLYTRSAGVAFFIVGAVLCSLIVKTLKRCFRQPRPVVVNGRKKKTYGMPSTHSATITFFATYISLSCAHLPTHPSLLRLLPASAWRAAAPVLVVPLASTIALSRLWLGHHTVPQVAAGVGCGLVLAPAWFALWTDEGWGWAARGAEVEAVVRAYLHWW